MVWGWQLTTGVLIALLVYLQILKGSTGALFWHAVWPLLLGLRLVFWVPVFAIGFMLGSSFVAFALHSGFDAWRVSYNCVEICCAEGREEVLVRLHETIESCEKALNDYLEQKKKAFPRFYFVANQALLNILSNGNKPLKVAESGRRLRGAAS